LIFKEMPKHNDDEDEEELASRELALWAEMGLHNQCIGAFNNERAVYRRLKDLQGKSIPRVVAEVELPDFYSTQYCSPDISSEIGRTLGLLTEYFDGFNLEGLGRPTERFKEPPAQGEHVQIITDRVLDIVRTIMSRGVLNCDSKLRNTLIRWDSVEKRYRPYVIDFGGCSLQEEFSTEEEWRSARWEWTEEDNWLLHGASDERTSRWCVRLPSVCVCETAGGGNERIYQQGVPQAASAGGRTGKSRGKSLNRGVDKS
jgi:serine/threonine protein kinase